MNRHTIQKAPARAHRWSRQMEAKAERDLVGAGRAMRTLLRADGVFEAALGIVLILSLGTDLYDVLSLPAPASRPVVGILGVLLVPLLPVLWWAARTPRRGFVLQVAAANGVSAIVFALWVVIGHKAFRPSGATFVLAVAGVLTLLAALQARAAR